MVFHVLQITNVPQNARKPVDNGVTTTDARNRVPQAVLLAWNLVHGDVLMQAALSYAAL